LEQYRQFKTDRRKIEWLAGRFAAKEAASKAVGTGIIGLINLHDFEIIQGEHGKPILRVSETIRSLFSDDITFHLSITHTQNVAGAVVILEKAPF
jgi:holo-[acyl-carrier protein] synthase